MKSLERLNPVGLFRGGLIAFGTIACLALLSTSAHRTVLASTAAEDDGTAIRPFRVDVPESDLADLRRRIQATRWPDKETVADRSQGPQLAQLQELVRYWGTDYEWREAEAKLNALPQFVTTIDGLEIQFIHVRSRHPNALPLIMTHGWPGSVLELLKVIRRRPPWLRAMALSGRSVSMCRKRSSSNSDAESPLHGGPTRRPLRITPRACRSG